MAIPDFQSLMLPLLEAIGDGNDHTNSEITKKLAQQFNLTEEELQQTLPSGPTKLFYSRVAWAKAYFKKADIWYPLPEPRAKILDMFLTNEPQDLIDFIVSQFETLAGFIPVMDEIARASKRK